MDIFGNSISAERANDVAAIVLVIVTIILYFTGRSVQSNANEKIAQSNAQAAKSNEIAKLAEQKAAEANVKLLELQQRVGFRVLQRERFVDQLKKKPSAKAEIIYDGSDREAHYFADEVHWAMSDAGWEVDNPKPGKHSGSDFALNDGTMDTNALPVLIILVSEADFAPTDEAREKKWKSHEDKTPLAGIVSAFQVSGMTPLVGVPYESARPPSGTIRIFIGSREYK